MLSVEPAGTMSSPTPNAKPMISSNNEVLIPDTQKVLHLPLRPFTMAPVGL